MYSLTNIRSQALQPYFLCGKFQGGKELLLRMVRFVCQHWLVAGNFNKENGTGCGRRFVPYFAPETVDDVLNDRQSKAHSAGFGGKIRFKKVLLCFFANPAAIIAD